MLTHPNALDCLILTGVHADCQKVHMVDSLTNTKISYGPGLYDGNAMRLQGAKSNKTNSITVPAGCLARVLHNGQWLEFLPGTHPTPNLSGELDLAGPDATPDGISKISVQHQNVSFACPPSRRNCRLGFLREHIRTYLKSVLFPSTGEWAAHPGKTTVCFHFTLPCTLTRITVQVIFVDGDVWRLPSWSRMRHSLNVVVSHTYGAVFANGKENDDWDYNGDLGKYYDTFASITSKGRFERVWQDVHGQFGDRSHLRRHGPQVKTLVPVQSAFGGLGIYNAALVWFSGCSYTDLSTSNLRPFIKDETDLEALKDEVAGWPCEHVIFHRCIKEQKKRTTQPLAVSVEMVVLRTSDPYGIE